MAEFIPTISNFGAQFVNKVTDACTYIDSGVRNVINESGRTLTAIPLAFYGVQGANQLTAYTNVAFCDKDSAKFVAIIGAVHSFVRGLGNVAAEGKQPDDMKNRKLVEWTVTIASALAIAKHAGLQQNSLKSLAVAAVVYGVLSHGHDKLTKFLNKEVQAPKSGPGQTNKTN